VAQVDIEWQERPPAGMTTVKQSQVIDLTTRVLLNPTGTDGLFLVPLPEAITTLARCFYDPPAPALPQRPSCARRASDRTLDLVLGVVLLIVMVPLFLLVSVSIKLTSPGPVFYRQVRIGRGGQPFRCMKFRTMVMDADKQLASLLLSSDDLRGEFLQTYKLKNDPRITKIGRVLRKTSLDELPQLLNVLVGDMSLVGPRPVVPAETDRYGEALMTVLLVRPGVTGVWQVSGRNDCSYDERVRLDVEYATGHSTRTNISVLLRTTLVVLNPRQKGAY
jgi:lipopolysaccharide/colanic/teichoic acid biosynthesis glycosyltransferase